MTTLITAAKETRSNAAKDNYLYVHYTQLSMSSIVIN